MSLSEIEAQGIAELLAQYPDDQRLIDILDKAGWVHLGEPGNGPYYLDPEGHAWEVHAADPNCREPSEFVDGCHGHEMATAVAAFMNWWWRETQRTTA